MVHVYYTYFVCLLKAVIPDLLPDLVFTSVSCLLYVCCAVIHTMQPFRSDDGLWGIPAQRSILQKLLQPAGFASCWSVFGVFWDTVRTVQPRENNTVIMQHNSNIKASCILHFTLQKLICVTSLLKNMHFIPSLNYALLTTYIMKVK